jgi:hypothetical protein
MEHPGRLLKAVSELVSDHMLRSILRASSSSIDPPNPLRSLIWPCSEVAPLEELSYPYSGLWILSRSVCLDGICNGLAPHPPFLFAQ